MTDGQNLVDNKVRNRGLFRLEEEARRCRRPTRFQIGNLTPPTGAEKSALNCGWSSCRQQVLYLQASERDLT
jgi:hypothetical protein